MEQWRPVVGWEGAYEVSDLGRVRSLDRGGRKGRLLKGVPISKDKLHLRVGLSLRGHQTKVLVHRLVLEAFVGPQPAGHEACHYNDVPTDNRLENLSWGTKSQNLHDRVRNGLHHEAKKTHCKRGHELTEENTYVRPNDNRRECYKCKKARDKKSDEMRKR